MLVSQPGAAGAAASGCNGRRGNACWLLVLVLDARRSDALQDVGKDHMPLPLGQTIAVYFPRTNVFIARLGGCVTETGLAS